MMTNDFMLNVKNKHDFAVKMPFFLTFNAGNGMGSDIRSASPLESI